MEWECNNLAGFAEESKTCLMILIWLVLSSQARDLSNTAWSREAIKTKRLL